MRQLSLDGLRQDLRFALRSFASRANRTAIVGAILTLAIAFGASTTIVTLLDAVLLRPLDQAGTSRLVSAGLTPVSDRSVGPSLAADLALYNAYGKTFPGEYFFIRNSMTTDTI